MTGQPTGLSVDDANVLTTHPSRVDNPDMATDCAWCEDWGMGMDPEPCRRHYQPDPDPLHVPEDEPQPIAGSDPRVVWVAAALLVVVALIVVPWLASR
jgi:hypothetical protein